MNPIVVHPTTRNQLTGTRARLAAVATQGTVTRHRPARREEVARQVARLRTIDDVRALSEQAGEDHRAGFIDDDILSLATEVARLARLELSAVVVVKGCPTWCNAHHFAYGDDPREDVDRHRHLIEGDGWLVELAEPDGGRAGSVHFVDASGAVVPLHEARAYATALLAGCDAVEATR